MKMKTCNFAKIAFALPIDTEFDYLIPEKLRSAVDVGKRVWVPFRNRKEIGVIVGFSAASDFKTVKEVASVIDSSPIISAEMLELARWISRTYICSLGEAVSAMIPGVLKKGKTSIRMRSRGNEGPVSPNTKEEFTLTTEQQFAVNSILEKVEKKISSVFLLHGITGSGKTEVYLRVIAHMLRDGKGSIVLVPEIALTPQTVRRFVSRFGDKVAVIHSRLTGSMRFAEWKRIKDGDAKIVIGARSAVFSPVRNLGVIIVDEEHETSYKQEDVPRYHARDVAIRRGGGANCQVVLGTATPSLESYYQTKQGTYDLLRLTRRINYRQLPKVKVVDMRMEVATRRRVVMFSKLLIDELDGVLDKKKQAMVFLNRRGFSTYINCKKCGYVMKCKRCDAILVYHFAKKVLMCHYCSVKMHPPGLCPKCMSGYINYFGIGTEKVESELARLVPRARISRMDSDVTAKKGAHERILGDFREHKIDILVGTQMIAKGLDFPKVTLVGVVNADVTLNLPDFRSSERTFNLITQVAGRAGRGEFGGGVILQTYSPDHYAILTAAKHNYEKFYELETKSREQLRFPPFSHLIKITVRSRDEKRTEEATAEIAENLKKGLKNMDLIGPAPAPIARIRGYYRWNILLRGNKRSLMVDSLRECMRKSRKPSGVLVAIDVDPISM